MSGLEVAGLLLGVAHARPKKPLSTRKLSPNCFLEVWDVSILSHGSVSRAAALSRISLRNESEWASAITRLPEHEPDTIRIYISEVSDAHHSMLDGSVSRAKPALTDLGGAAKTFLAPLHRRRESESIQSASSIQALISQWNSSSPPEWYESLGWYFLKPKNNHWESPILQVGMGREIRGIMDDVGDIMGRTHQQWAHLLRNIRLSEENGQLKVFISCRTLYDSNTPNRVASPCIATNQFTANFIGLESTYQLFRSRSNQRQIILLQYHHANLRLLGTFIERVSSCYADRRQQDFDPRQSKLRLWNLKAIMDDASYYRQFTSAFDTLEIAIELLLDIVTALAAESGESNTSQTKANILILRAELHSCCRDTKLRLEKLSSGLEQDLRFLGLSRDLNQSNDVQKLTLLATIFLPLSLSAGVLSMQYRFHELGARLYDFVGIVVLLVFIVIVFLALLFGYGLGRELEGRFQKYRFYNTYIKPIAVRLFGVCVLTHGLLILASFLVGMFKDVSLGARILGYGIPAAAGGPLVLLLLYLIAMWLGTWVITSCSMLFVKPAGSRSHLEGKKQKKKQRDPENNQPEVIDEVQDAKQESIAPDVLPTA